MTFATAILVHLRHPTAHVRLPAKVGHRSDRDGPGSSLAQADIMSVPGSRSAMAKGAADVRLGSRPRQRSCAGNDRSRAAVHVSLNGAALPRSIHDHPTTGLGGQRPFPWHILDGSTSCGCYGEQLHRAPHHGLLLEHRTEKWNPVFGKTRCLNKEIDRPSCVRMDARRSSGLWCARRALTLILHSVRVPERHCL
ncbi:hypothetical protein FG93_03266 [Bosea sp. LC85]|nr:hypothetical protein FG93_03266 [Bosea sp. LC85]